MISERQQIAERFRSEGGQRLVDNRRKGADLQEIESKPTRRLKPFVGSRAQATQIYANAFNQSDKSVEFYEFTKSLESYEPMLNRTLHSSSTDIELFKFLKDIEPGE